MGFGCFAAGRFAAAFDLVGLLVQDRTRRATPEQGDEEPWNEPVAVNPVRPRPASTVLDDDSGVWRAVNVSTRTRLPTVPTALAMDRSPSRVGP